MQTTSALNRRTILASAAASLIPAIPKAAGAATRGVSDTEIIIGMMTDLSGVTAVQGSNAAKAIRMAFDDVNARGGIHGRKIRFIVEDNEYIVPKAVQAMNKLLNRDNIFFAIGERRHAAHGRGAAHDDREAGAERVPADLRAVDVSSRSTGTSSASSPRTTTRCAPAVKYFAETTRQEKSSASMYQDTDFGKDVHAGVVAQIEAMGMKLAAVTAHRPTDTDFNAPLTRLHDAGCDMICMGTIVKDTTIILQTARKMGWDVRLAAASSPAIRPPWPRRPASRPRASTRCRPALYRYPDDPRPAVRAFFEKYRAALRHRPELSGRGRLYPALFA